jgi:hypothetical protein
VNRRAAWLVVRILFALLLVSAITSVGHGHPSVLASGVQAAPIGTDDIPIDTVNPFLPDEQDLTACVGSLQRPGCGSSARGGWHQDLVAIAMVGGLVIVFGRVFWGVARNRRTMTLGADEGGHPNDNGGPSGDDVSSAP